MFFNNSDKLFLLESLEKKELFSLFFCILLIFSLLFFHFTLTTVLNLSLVLPFDDYQFFIQHRRCFGA
jgi:hypothetical protein